ncbi:hypothetical protein OEZ85_006926 [Tetradesmus obliquus]|uniref:Tyrosine-protein kinase ephrin type A/B receptor-like domain-containing protein n=1 Tax=Tetradesmus obliquus TaxID=3088 RepID=A0ABY8TW26_TETOB|nr:hypothetical protein OEZ85_006926 [Tetradesmus obliquus]
MNSVETYVCLRCRTGYVPVKGSDGKSVVQCVCPPGTFQNNSATPKTCVPCTTGSFCPGGDPKARTPADNIGGNPMSCNVNNSTGLTTKSQRSTRRADCIAQAGYVLPATAGTAAQECTGSTYAPAFNRLRSCLPCQSGLAAPLDYTGARDDKLAVCQVPPGKFWELNVVRDCPKGLYREEYVRTDNKTSIACLSCPEGWTTQNIGTPRKSLCNVLLPGYQDAIEDCIVAPGSGVYNGNDTNPWSPTDPINPNTPAKECPIGFYTNNDTLATSNTCQACSNHGSTTAPGSTSCTVCAAGYGKSQAGAACTACAYGSYNQGSSESCNTCPQTTFNDFAYLAVATSAHGLLSF